MRRSGFLLGDKGEKYINDVVILIRIESCKTQQNTFPTLTYKAIFGSDLALVFFRPRASLGGSCVHLGPSSDTIDGFNRPTGTPVFSSCIFNVIITAAHRRF